MNFLLDTHLLIWGASQNQKLSRQATEIMANPNNSLWFSVASMWETAIKNSLNRPDFPYEVGTLRVGLLANGYRELSIEGRHALAFREIKPKHRDPFDRMLVAQAFSEGMIFLTSDAILADYGDWIRVV